MVNHILIFKKSKNNDDYFYFLFAIFQTNQIQNQTMKFKCEKYMIQKV